MSAYGVSINYLSRLSYPLFFDRFDLVPGLCTVLRDKTPEEVQGVFYTEDDIPIRTLYVSNLMYKTTERKIEEYFSKYGEVEKVIIRTNNLNNYTYCFVTFINCEDASK